MVFLQSYRKALLLTLSLIIPVILSAQSSGISGVVIDESGEPYIGATVMVRGNTLATITDVDGKFTLDVSENATLVVSYIGCETATVVAYAGKPVTIVLKPDALALDAGEVVAVGYGTQKKESVVAAISTIRPDELRVPVRSLSQSLAGNVAGLVALQSSGEPGKDDAQFWIRGIATFTGDPNPLVLVDGVERPLENVDPLEIESFSVLKDASATAVYGVRGANGVILINTRRGFDGPARIDVRYEQGFSSPSKRLSFVDAATRSMLFNEAVDATPGISSSFKYQQAEIDAMRSGIDPEVYPNVDWQKVLMKDITLSEKVSANISGGGKFARYFTSISFYNQEGQFAVNPGQYSWIGNSIGSFGANVNYTRYNFRANVDMDITPTTTVSVGLQGNVSENKEPAEGGAASIYRDIINAAPNAFPVKLKDGRLAGRDGLNNPYNMLTQRGYAKTLQNALRANLSIDQDFKFITQGLSAKLTYAYDYTTNAVDTNSRDINFFEVTGRDESGDLIANEWQADKYQDYLNYSHSSSSTRSQYAELTINYQRYFDKHDVGALVMGFAKDYRLMTQGMTYINSLPNRSIGLAARATYGYDNRYLIEANIGFNGSENFAKNNRMGIFPALALGWVASEENFLKGNKVLTWAKMRLSVGQVGSDQIPATRFIYLATMNDSASGYSNIGVNFNQYQGGIGEGRMANENVTWEVATKYNIGLELGFLSSLRLNGDVFYERRENIFLSPQASEIAGLPNGYDIYSNMGVMENRGFEISGEYQKRIGKDLYITARGNFTFTRNKVISDGKYYAYPWQDLKGARYGLTLGYKAMHLFSEEELASLPDYYEQFSMDKTQLRPGDIRYEDLNDDGKITEADRTWIGNPSMPEIVYGFGASLNWKGLDFSFLFQGAGNRSAYLTGGWYFQPFQADRGPKHMGNVMTAFLDRWTEDNPDPYAFSPRLSYGANANNYKTSTWWQRDASYLRLKNVEIGYTLPDKWAKKIYANSLRIYLQGVNLFTISKFYKNFWDPETGADVYPMQRVVFVGLNVSF
ncbi:MAG: TonB-dependent receptor [Clostridium sp.]|nr:TonB-dependent receptor [Bacteroides sp.]MCM1197744.1 TonB-dependent receptor [Clostridium sp.]